MRCTDRLQSKFRGPNRSAGAHFRYADDESLHRFKLWTDAAEPVRHDVEEAGEPVRHAVREAAEPVRHDAVLVQALVRHEVRGPDDYFGDHDACHRICCICRYDTSLHRRGLCSL